MIPSPDVHSSAKGALAHAKFGETASDSRILWVKEPQRRQKKIIEDRGNTIVLGRGLEHLAFRGGGRIPSNPLLIGLT